MSRWLLALYPRGWRERYGAEVADLTDERGHAGPYRWVRHPSYTGLLLIAAGIGLAAGTWPGLVVCLVLPAAAMLLRIRVEEAALTRVLGDPYRAYQSRAKRLIPGLW
jgi:protein-S-isoprenylcysteine O-methyltransferase Ste14